MKAFLKQLSKYRGKLNMQQIKTLRGQALAGDLQGAKRGLVRVLGKLN